MNKNNWIVLLILFIWFVISFVTNILGPMLPMIIDSFGLSLTLAAFLPFSFFLAYGIMSIPAGMIIERFGGKISLLIAFSLAFLGAGLFVMFPTYSIVLTSLFAIGLGMAMLQVIILPLMREAGGEKKYAFNQVLAQIVFGAASFMSPFVLAGLMRKLTGEDRLLHPFPQRDNAGELTLELALFYLYDCFCHHVSGYLLCQIPESRIKGR